MKVLVGNIQRFCLDDGPGIRTTVFLKGCSLRCPWCCNPENLIADIQTGISGKVYGRWMSEEQIFDEVIKDKNYYLNGGGVTFSGGECLLNLCHMKDLLVALRNEKINIGIETGLFVPLDNIKQIIDLIDFCYVDFKILIPHKAKEILHGDTEQFFENLRFLKLNGNSQMIHPRMPVVPGINDDKDNIQAIVLALKDLNLNKIELFSVHNLGQEKYKDLDIEYSPFESLTKESLGLIAEFFNENGIEATILSVN